MTHLVYISSPVFSSILYQIGANEASQKGTLKIERDNVAVPESVHGSCPSKRKKSNKSSHCINLYPIMSVGNSPHVYRLGRFVRFNSSTCGGLPFYSLMLISNKMHDQIIFQEL